MVFVFFLCRYLEVLSSLTLIVILPEKIFSTSIYPTHQLTANRAYRFTVIQALILKQDRTNYIQTILDIRLFNLHLKPSGMAISTMSLHTVTVRKYLGNGMKNLFTSTVLVPYPEYGHFPHWSLLWIYHPQLLQLFLIGCVFQNSPRLPISHDHEKQW